MSSDSDSQKIAQIRRDYAREKLNQSAVEENPIEQFNIWFQQALSADLLDPNAMTLSTATAEGHPSSRVVLLKGFDESGFRFYTNYSSRKGRQLKENPHAALCFYWPALERQVRIEGSVCRVSREDSRSYFQQRPRLSQLGAWASKQSSRVPSREILKEKFDKVKKRFEGEEVPLPEFWGGYLLKPEWIEFWQGREGRMHDRICYEKVEENWNHYRLAP